MLLSDDEQKQLLDELYNTTRTKIEACIRKYGLDKIPADVLKEVQDLRREVKAGRNGRGWFNAAKHAVGVFFAEGDKLLK